MLYNVAMKRRLGIEFAEQPYFGPLCHQIVGSFAGHALTCRCGSDVTKRHNSLRNALFCHRGPHRAFPTFPSLPSLPSAHALSFPSFDATKLSHENRLENTREMDEKRERTEASSADRIG